MVTPDSDPIAKNGFHISFDAEAISAKYEAKLNTPAVSVENAYKKYGNGPPILNNFNMTVQRGTIYGLLGSSGCGKTTILSCIVGLKKLERGAISVFGAQPGTKESGIPGRTIGYMCQEIALYQIFSIKEILQYYGRIYGMTKTEVQARMEFLLNFLDLPDYDRRIDSLSGGQQRRVSLAVAMVHQPELLILDEPTVGVDPLVRESIWEYLCELVAKRKTTVIITTHYIEESRNADMIGLMRSGRLLTERPPTVLLEEHSCDLLEDIVLKLCKKDNNSMFADSNAEVPNDAKLVRQALAETSFYSHKKQSSQAFYTQRSVVGLTYKYRSPDDLTIGKPRRVDRRRQSVVQNFSDDISSHINKIQSVTIKNLTTLIRYPLFLIAFLLIPALQIVLFNYIMGSEPKYSQMGVVNHEFESTDYLKMCKEKPVGCLNDRLSCDFLNLFPDTEINWLAFSTEEEALRNVKRGHSLGFITIPANFSQNMKDRSLERNFATNETLDGTEIASRIDMSFNIKGVFVRTRLYEGYLKFIKSIASNCGEDPRAVELPLKYNPIYGALNGGMLEFMQPGQILLIIFLLPMASCVVFVWDRRAGTLDRTMVAGVEFYHILIAFIFSEGLMIVIELTLCLSVLKFAFDVTIEGSIFLIFLLCLLQGITGLSFGFLFGTLCDHEIEAMICVLGLYLPVMTSSGGTWPVEAIVWWLRPVCELLPATLPIEAIRSIVSRGWGISHPSVYLGFVSLISWIIICCFLSGVIHHRRK